PLVLAILGEEWVIYASAFIFTQQAVLWSHGKSVIEGKRGMDLKAMFKNVNLLACFAGLFMFLLRLKVPPVLQGAVRSLGGIIGPVTMLTMGMIFAGTDMGKMIRGKRIWIIAFLKMILIPGTVILAMKLSGIAALAPDGRTVLFISLLACMTPTATSVTQMAQLYNSEPGYATAINTVTTMMCLVTMPLMTLLYEL
ncbi:MAG: AEC family transporter, partial [Stomatobaculum sp.]|nr:AEC family transporter [Stomatobaculum sp.]